MTRNRDYQVDLVDLQFAVRDVERDRLEVRIVVAELARCKTHRVRACCGLRDGCRAREHDLARVEQFVLARCVVARDGMFFAVIVHFVLVTRNRDYQVDLVDLQFAGGEGRGCVVGGDVVACCVHNRERFSKAARVGRICNIRALGRGVGDRQNVALAQAFYLIVISLDRLARAGDRRNERTAFLFGAVIDLLDVLDRHGQRSRRDIQGAEGCIDLIVARLVLAPVDGVGVITAAYRRLRTGHAERDRLARAEGDRAGRSRFCRSPLAADVRGPVAVGQRCAFHFCQFRAVIRLFGARRRDRQRERLDHKEAVTGIERDRVVRIAHHRLSVYRYARNRRSLLRAGHRIGACILFGDHRTVRSVQRIPDRAAVFLFEQRTLSACNVDISGPAGIVIETLLVGVGETDIEGLTGVVVRTFTAGVRVPLVRADADIYADRLDRQAARNVDDAVVRFWIGDRFRAFADLRILRRRRARARIRLRTFEFHGCQRVAAQSTGDRVVAAIIEAAVQRRTVISL